MLEILVCEDKLAVAELYRKSGLQFDDDKLAIRAMFDDEVLGYCLFDINADTATVFAVEPTDDIMLADGLLRSALHVGNERGITEAFYSNIEYEALFEKINFLEDKEQKKLKLQNLFSDCCHCAKE